MLHLLFPLPLIFLPLKVHSPFIYDPYSNLPTFMFSQEFIHFHGPVFSHRGTFSLDFLPYLDYTKTCIVLGKYTVDVMPQKCSFYVTLRDKWEISLLSGGGVRRRRAELPRRYAGVDGHAADGSGGAHREGDPDHQLALPAPARWRRQALRHQRLQDDVRERSELRQENQGGDEFFTVHVI